MEAIVLTDDELRRLETRFGPVVRQMGPWNSDGVFGYASVPIAAVEKAAETFENPDLLVAILRLRTPERTNRSGLRRSSNCWRVPALFWSRESSPPTGNSLFGLIHRCR